MNNSDERDYDEEAANKRLLEEDDTDALELDTLPMERLLARVATEEEETLSGGMQETDASPSRQFRVVKWYNVRVPMPGTPDYVELTEKFFASDPEYGVDPENKEPHVLVGNLVFWLTEQTSFPDNVDLTDYNVEEV